MRCAVGRGLVVIAMFGCGVGVQHPKLSMSLPVQRYALGNGITAILVPDPAATMATMVMRYGVGAVDDPEHQEGVAHLAAHLMYDQRPGGTSLASQLERIAIDLEVEPRPTETRFYARFAPEHLDAAVKLEAVRMQVGCDRIDDAAFASERSNLATELLTHPSWHLNRVIGEAIYPAGDPMRRAYAADADTVAAITHAQVCDFISRRYAPANATIVVTGPIEAAQFQHALAPMNALPARPFDAHAVMPQATGGSTHVEGSAEVPEPTLAVAFPMPTDPAEEMRASILLDRAASVLDAGEFDDGRYLVLWIRPGDATIDARLAELTTALANSVDALGVRSTTRRTGRRPVRRLGVSDFERSPEEDLGLTRTRYIVQSLGTLDNAIARVTAIASGKDLEKPLAALVNLDEAALRHTLATSIDVSRAKVIVLQPDGTRPPTRFMGLVEPTHELRRRLDLDAASENVQPQPPPSVLERAQTVRLANGLTVVLAPSSSIPIVNVRLMFAAGIAETSLRRTAHTAIAALMSAVINASNERGVRLHWYASWDSVELSLTGTATDIEHRLHWLAGLSTLSGFHDAAAQGVRNPPRETLKAGVTATRDDAFRAHVYGEHPYGASVEAAGPGRIPTAEDVERFYQQYLQPNNATLVVTGGFAPDDVLRSIHQAFDSWTGSGQLPALGSPARGTGAALAINVTSPSVELRLGWLGGPPDADFATREVIAEMIDRLDPQVRSSYVSHRFGGHYAAYGVFDPKTAASDISALRSAIAALADGSSASKQLFAVSRRAVALKVPGEQISSAGWASLLVHVAELGHDLAWRQQLGGQVAKVGYDDVRRVLANEPFAGATWLVAGPEDSVRAVYGGLGLTPTTLPTQ